MKSVAVYGGFHKVVYGKSCWLEYKYGEYWLYFDGDIKAHSTDKEHMIQRFNSY
ncbi:hypothetical protein Hs30E_18750 [Lactococcus hodotermopsidis]|uniref:Uncharacterized protein n=1 Tax=Pseudolactococcus hodotermopsidis TaxID=2709157 RepID=A0A6A0BFR1_9LACT|nr:hypothetical protein Hs30E_18750 [Lactococcus hodotermopsidis]